MLPVLEEGMKRVSNAARPSRASSLSAKTKQRKAIIAKKNKQMEKDGIFKVVSLASKILATLTVTLMAHCNSVSNSIPTGRLIQMIEMSHCFIILDFYIVLRYV